VEALLLLGVHVSARDAAVGSEVELELEQLAVGVGRRAQELDALTADGVLDDLSGVCHGRLLALDCVPSRLQAIASSVVGRDDDPGSA
jgi:hypothetical protein